MAVMGQDKLPRWAQQGCLALACSPRVLASLSALSFSSYNCISVYQKLPNCVRKWMSNKEPFSLNLFFLVSDFFYSCCCSVTQCLTLCNPMDCSTPGFPVLHYLLGPAQTHVHWVSDAIQPSCPMSSLSPPAFNLSQNQGPFQWVSSSHQVAKALELQLQHQYF